MTCENAIEFLPWLLNGTLGEEEGGEVRRHLETCESCRQALAETREAWRLFDQHVPTAALVAYAWGDTPAGLDTELLERHLESCPQCAAELEMARTSRGLEGDDKIALFPGKPSRELSRERREPRVWRAAALAAGLAGVVAAGGWINSARQVDSLLAENPPSAVATPSTPTTSSRPADDGALRERLAELEKEKQQLEAEQAALAAQAAESRDKLALLIREASPQPQISWSNELYSQGDVVRGPGAENDLTAPAGEPLNLFLQPEDGAKEYPRYEIEILGAGRKAVWGGQGARLSDKGDFSLLIPAGFLPKGEYEIRVYGSNGGKRAERVGAYGLRIE